MSLHAHPHRILSLRDQHYRTSGLGFQILTGSSRIRVVASDLLGAVEVRWATDSPGPLPGDVIIHWTRPLFAGHLLHSCDLDEGSHCYSVCEPSRYSQVFAALVHDDDLGELVRQMVRIHDLTK